MELFNDIQSGCEADLFQPLLTYLRAKENKQVTPPYIPKWDVMAIPTLCKLALAWHETGFKQEAGELVHFLLPLQDFLPLWSQEKQYNESEAKRLFSLLSGIEPIAGKQVDIEIVKTVQMSSAFTLSGNGTSLGMIRTKDVEIRAIGPQSASLQFGIQGKGMDGWTRCFAYPEIWFEMKTLTRESECKIDLRFVGLKPETPIAFAFYVKAVSCHIGNQILKPKSLQRFYGEAQKAVFQNKLKIESAQVHKVQVIPLAGEGCFWDCEFLLSFEMHPLVPQACFSIQLI